MTRAVTPGKTPIIRSGPFSNFFSLRLAQAGGVVFRGHQNAICLRLGLFQDAELDTAVLGAALLHALILGLSLYTLLSEARAARGLAALPRWAWILVLPAALAMGLFP